MAERARAAYSAADVTQAHVRFNPLSLGNPTSDAALQASLRCMEEEEWRRTHLQALITRLRDGLAPLVARGPWRLSPSHTAIQPLIIGRNDAALRVMHGLQEQGLWVPAIRPPTVPAGTARLRIALSAARSFER